MTTTRTTRTTLAEIADIDHDLDRMRTIVLEWQAGTTVPQVNLHEAYKVIDDLLDLRHELMQLHRIGRTT